MAVLKQTILTPVTVQRVLLRNYTTYGTMTYGLIWHYY